MDSEHARNVFLTSARMDLQTRYRNVRHVVTSKELMDEISRLAGWEPVRWYDGDEENIHLSEDGELHSFNQTVCVLRAPDGNEVWRTAHAGDPSPWHPGGGTSAKSARRSGPTSYRRVDGLQRGSRALIHLAAKDRVSGNRPSGKSFLMPETCSL